MIQGTLCILLSIQQFIFDRYACAISDPDNEEVIITGGRVTMTTVSVYSEAGWQRDLAPLNQGRYEHACSSFISEGERVKAKTLEYRTGRSPLFWLIYAVHMPDLA